MEQRLKYIGDRVSIPLLVVGVLLTLSAVGSALSLALSAQKPEGFHPVAAAGSLIVLLATGMPAVLTFAFRRRPRAPRWGRISGGLLALYGLGFPAAVLSGAPFFIPLFLYLVAATGIWALLRSR